jgi:hypothetical protein
LELFVKALGLVLDLVLVGELGLVLFLAKIDL